MDEHERDSAEGVPDLFTVEAIVDALVQAMVDEIMKPRDGSHGFLDGLQAAITWAYSVAGFSEQDGGDPIVLAAGHRQAAEERAAENLAWADNRRGLARARLLMDELERGLQSRNRTVWNDAIREYEMAYDGLPLKRMEEAS